VLVYYWLKSAPESAIKLELLDSKGVVRACVASDTPVKPVDTEAINVQAIWEEPSPPPSATPGLHRVTLNIVAPRFGGFGRPAAPPPHDACSPTAGSEPAPIPARPAGVPRRRSPVALVPGNYMVRLTVDGQTYMQPAVVAPDPRGTPIDNADEQSLAND
jgi:hypothetical protein